VLKWQERDFERSHNASEQQAPHQDDVKTLHIFRIWVDEDCFLLQGVADDLNLVANGKLVPLVIGVAISLPAQLVEI